MSYVDVLQGESKNKSLICNILLAEGENTKDSMPTSNLTESIHDEDEREVPSVVIYLVEPFTLGSDQPELHRLSLLALLRCYQSILTAVPENIRNNISVQVSESLELILWFKFMCQSDFLILCFNFCRLYH